MIASLKGFKIGKVVALLLAACMVVALSACDQSNSSGTGNTSGSSTQSGTPIKIGLTVSKGGDFSADGKALEQGYQIWADYVNQHGGILNRKVQLDILDDNSTKTQVVSDYQKLINANHDDLVLGPYSSSLTLAAAPIAKRYNYAFIEGAGVAPSIFDAKFPNLFSVSLSAKNYLTSFVYYLLALPAAQRPKSIAYVTADDFFTQPQVDSAKTQLEKGGITTALYNVYPAETTDYAPIAQKAINSHPDVVILGTTSQTDAVALTKAFIQQHFNPKALIETAGPDQGNQFTDPLGGVSKAEGVFVPNNGWFPTIKSYQNTDFTSAYIAKYGGTANDISADSVEAFSAGQVLQQAVEKIHSLDNGKLIQELHSGDTFNSIQGPVKFASDGENTVAEPFLFQWQGGKLIPVYPANQAQANPEYPKKSWS
ncbi:amino acid ABC transporter substrate-binding protein [Dictyobacter arantiisoli]|uniref:Branched-chain amino acid ABC transporter substrate-binding protein n=1 Tax=Dictyobacter arantiisoli TaxID=2014874 RepID=A0A5A5TIT0_9CHLR|nr:amino acid ABC transporter substrate-binding protein [Dictyobacter arantiisoli]GCF11317.1 branched-chain amino acid ABC transporter substrate-binding protein [Dictyobacter arantiisoli]